MKTGDKQQQGADLSKPRPDKQRDRVDQREPRQAKSCPREAQGGGRGPEQVQLGQPGFCCQRTSLFQTKTQNRHLKMQDREKLHNCNKCIQTNSIERKLVFVSGQCGQGT